MRLPRFMRPKKAKQPSKLFVMVEETRATVDAIERTLLELLSNQQGAKPPKPEQQQGEVWEKFQAHSELIAAIDAAQAARTARSEQSPDIEPFEAFDNSGEEAAE